MNSMVRLGGTLLAISAIAALALGATNQVTAPVIEQRNIQANNELRKAVLPEAKEFKEMDKSTYKNLGDNLIAEVYEGLDGSEVVGYTLKAKPSGYGGEVEVMVGISSDGQVTGVDIGNMSETAGLGAKAKDDAFKGQYKGKTAEPLEVAKGSTTADNQILAISGATITSTAVTTGVNAAIDVFNSALNK
ncbi:RnfABCDGE type electron transport complex subunit G [Clostridioides sp. ES-S-0108-01]|uniref:RnfABCDGE type electron transport complex subunit G n=1 Tax=Clostridioides sp. ES-S-0108-01 TaxID=2770773 RepID=UPI001D0CD000|nr:RnfABCDGE type electron transport complex subunit G [Clostridioides sp. ES-S-0108-01]UDN52070.1 RnfABCDGE type electron transport complex subunit G [Clostridioides sp. ES-S-0107-01]